MKYLVLKVTRSKPAEVLFDLDFSEQANKKGRKKSRVTRTDILKAIRQRQQRVAGSYLVVPLEKSRIYGFYKGALLSEQPYYNAHEFNKRIIKKYRKTK